MDYIGYQELVLSDEDFSSLYTKKALSMENESRFLENEYLIAKDARGTIIDYFRYNNGEFNQVPFSCIQTDYPGIVKPRNPQQRIAIDMLKDPNIAIKMIGGCMGGGKDYLMLAQAYESISKGQFDKIVYVRNNISQSSKLIFLLFKAQ